MLERLVEGRQRGVPGHMGGAGDVLEHHLPGGEYDDYGSKNGRFEQKMAEKF